MTSFNLSAWAVRHRALMLFLMIALGFAGAASYMQLGRAEDPNFTIKVAVITAAPAFAGCEWANSWHRLPLRGARRVWSRNCRARKARAAHQPPLKHPKPGASGRLGDHEPVNVEAFVNEASLRTAAGAGGLSHGQHFQRASHDHLAAGDQSAEATSAGGGCQGGGSAMGEPTVMSAAEIEAELLKVDWTAVFASRVAVQTGAQPQAAPPSLYEVQPVDTRCHRRQKSPTRCS